MEAKETVGYSGFFDVEGYSRYAISKDGIVIFKPLNRALKGSVNPAGYVNIRITDDDGKTLTWGLHRLLCFVFKHPGKIITDLVVNHKDGNKSNNNLDNLEWTTYLGNLHHAGIRNLTNKCIPFSVKDYLTGVIETYPSAIDYARKIGVSKDTILWRLNKGSEYVFPENKQYRRGINVDPWPKEAELIFLNGSTDKPVLVKNAITGKITSYAKISYMAKDFNISAPTATAWINKKDQPLLPSLIQLKWYSDNTPWRIIENLELEINNVKKTGDLKKIKQSSYSGIKGGNQGSFRFIRHRRNG